MKITTQEARSRYGTLFHIREQRDTSSCGGKGAQAAPTASRFLLLAMVAAARSAIMTVGAPV